MTKRLTEEEFNVFVNSDYRVDIIDAVYRNFMTGDDEESRHGEFHKETGGFDQDILNAFLLRIPHIKFAELMAQGKIFYRNAKLAPGASIRILALLDPYVHHIDTAKKDFGLWENWLLDELSEIDTYEAYVLWFDDFYDAKGLDEVNPETTTNVCEVCKQTSKIFVEYNSDRMCPLCARKAFEHDSLKNAIEDLEKLLEMNLFKSRPIAHEKCRDVIVQLKSCIPWDSHAKYKIEGATPGTDNRSEKGLSMT